MESPAGHELAGGRSSFSHLDLACLRVPVESLLREFRASQKGLEVDATRLKNYVDRLEKRLSANASQETGDLEEVAEGPLMELANNIDRAIDFLKRMRTKAEGREAEALRTIEACELRLDELRRESDVRKTHEQPDFNFADYTKRLDCIIHEFLVRNGFQRTAKELEVSRRLEGLVDTNVFEEVHEIAASLLARETSKALTWCAVHRSKLKKAECTIETELHVQRLLELVMSNSPRAALEYAQTNLASSTAEFCRPQLRQAMAMLAFVQHPASCRLHYASLFSSSRWEFLAEKFHEAAATIYGYTVKSIIELTVQAGLQALKTRDCNGTSPSCPTCDPKWQSFIHKLPTPHHIRSCLICPINGNLMTDDDPPMMSPDGLVISASALRELQEQTPLAGGLVQCEPSGSAHLPSDFTRIFMS